MATPPPRDAKADGDEHPRRTYFGRQGSPEITVAFPFAKVEVARTDEALRAATIAALDAVAALAAHVEQLAQASSKSERAAIAAEVHDLRAELDELITAVAATGEG